MKSISNSKLSIKIDNTLIKKIQEMQKSRNNNWQALILE